MYTCICTRDPATGWSGLKSMFHSIGVFALNYMYFDPTGLGTVFLGVYHVCWRWKFGSPICFRREITNRINPPTLPKIYWYCCIQYQSPRHEHCRCRADARRERSLRHVEMINTLLIVYLVFYHKKWRAQDPSSNWTSDTTMRNTIISVFRSTF